MLAMTHNAMRALLGAALTAGLTVATLLGSGAASGDPA